ncbi:Amiloride-sensitive sodium channel-domain-containing protein [Hyaloraphidium curvatum]|nr:Amiloride-sensitive sodium channel-domain-containing protein [Hyaloraphidium curvatum]
MNSPPDAASGPRVSTGGSADTETGGSLPGSSASAATLGPYPGGTGPPPLPLNGPPMESTFASGDGAGGPAEKLFQAEAAGTAANGTANGLAAPLLPAPKPPDEDVDFVQEVYNITSVSTAHGVWRVFDRKRSMANRLCWAVLWLTAAGLFITYLVLQSMYLAESPTSTLITQEVVSPMPFPAVSICLSSLNTSLIRAFVRPIPPGPPQQQLETLLNSSGVLCYFGWRTLRQLWNSDYSLGTQSCRENATLTWADYPFASSPTLCITTPPGLLAEQPGVSLRFIGRLPFLEPFDTVTYSLRTPESQIEPLLSNFVVFGANTRVRFQTTISKSLKECDPNPGGQPVCFSRFQQQCIERACDCKYPVIEPGMAEEDLAAQLPGSCASKNREGTCTYHDPIFPCPDSKKHRNCTLQTLCGPTESKKACPLPSCEETDYPQVASLSPISETTFEDVANGTAGTLFVLSVLLETQTVTLIEETEAYTVLSYLGAVGGMMGLLLGFSVLTILEWFEGCFHIGTKVEEIIEEAAEDAGLISDSDDEEEGKAEDVFAGVEMAERAATDVPKADEPVTVADRAATVA